MIRSFGTLHFFTHKLSVFVVASPLPTPDTMLVYLHTSMFQYYIGARGDGCRHNITLLPQKLQEFSISHDLWISIVPRSQLYTDVDRVCPSSAEYRKDLYLAQILFPLFSNSYRDDSIKLPGAYIYFW